MGRDLSALQIKDSYQYLLQKSGSDVNDGLGNDVDFLNVSASYAYTSSEAIHALDADTATSASYATTASYAESALSSSYALTASFAENVTPINTGSFYVSSSISDATITFTQGDGSTEAVVVNNVNNAISASFATTAGSATTATTSSKAIEVYATASSGAGNFAVLLGGDLFTGGDFTSVLVDSTTTLNYNPFAGVLQATTFNGALNGNATTATSASHALQADTATLATTATSASHAVNADTAISSSYALTASYAEFHDDSTLQQVLNAGNTATGSIDLLGSIKATSFTGSLQGNATTATTASYALTATSSSYALTATSASHALNADNAVSASYAVSASHTLQADSATSASYAVSASHAIFADTAGGATDVNALYTASVADATISFLKGGGGTFPITINNVANAVSASHALNADTATSASYALTASYAEFHPDSTLQQVLDAGNTATQQITLSGSAGVSGSIDLINVGSKEANLYMKGGYVRIDTDNYNEFGGLEIGQGNTIRKDYGATSTTIGFGNTNNSANNGVVQGENNTLNSTSYNSVILASQLVNLTGDFSAVIAGTNISVNGMESVVVGAEGGSLNSAYCGMFSAHGSSISNGDTSVLLGGYQNNLQGLRTFILGGYSNSVQNNTDFSGIIGGELNIVYSNHTGSVIIGGVGLKTTKAEQVVVPMLLVTGSRDGDTATQLQVAGGEIKFDCNNFANHIRVNIGNNNSFSSTDKSAVMSLGSSITNNSQANGVAFGEGHTINSAGYNTFIGGGNGNTISSNKSAIIGGSSNTNSHLNSVILGGDTLSTSRSEEAVVQHLSIYGDAVVNSKIIVSGSAVGEVNTIAVASNTGSMDCSAGNFFTIALQNGVDTQLEATNIQAGQVINLRITNNATSAGTISFGSGFAFEGGVPFSVTATTNAVDIMTFTTFDTSTLYGVGIQNFS
jgi:hypothetical protein